jgi:hypothetical protein
LRARAAAGKDASEADLAVLQHQLDTVEPLDANERTSTLSVGADSEVDIATIVTAIRQTAASA